MVRTAAPATSSFACAIRPPLQICSCRSLHCLQDVRQNAKLPGTRRKAKLEQNVTLAEEIGGSVVSFLVLKNKIGGSA
ncbi:hypothetical protein PVAP13_9NG498614 [Panicum virgatum]|uniref:Uncharacterized protein n=1 Tax=Panicum virgatum TaxID=38727 RepID=A0A8T0MW85_PANVG|nr:hypothetical protein PVAP13_9NG498614 [Panicum virgatum]